MSDRHLARAMAFLERIPFVDGHNDLPYVMRQDASAKGDVAAFGLDRAHQGYDTDIPRLREGRVGGQVWAAFCPSNQPDPTRFTLELIQSIRALNALHPDVFLPALRASDIARAKRQGKIASFIGVESGIGIGDRLEMLDIFHALGARVMTLCHNETLAWVDSATDEPRHNGLTDFGRQVIRRMNALGMLVDMAHTSPKAMHDVLDVTTAPVSITHANAARCAITPQRGRRRARAAEGERGHRDGDLRADLHQPARARLVQAAADPRQGAARPRHQARHSREDPLRRPAGARQAR